jgi:hypothetical protein
MTTKQASDLKTRRVEAGITRKVAAEAAGISQNGRHSVASDRLKRRSRRSTRSTIALVPSAHEGSSSHPVRTAGGGSHLGGGEAGG